MGAGRLANASEASDTLPSFLPAGTSQPIPCVYKGNSQCYKAIFPGEEQEFEENMCFAFTNSVLSLAAKAMISAQETVPLQTDSSLAFALSMI